MTKLAIGVEKYLEGEVSFALGRIVRVDGNEVVEMDVPVGTNRLVTLDLLPGHYIVQVTMPTGAVLSRAIALGETDGEVRFRSQHSAHEWLSWSNFTSGTGAEGSILPRTNFGPGEDLASVVRQREIELVSDGERVPINLGFTSAQVNKIPLNIKTESDPPYVVVTLTTPLIYSQPWPRLFLRANSSAGRMSMSAPIPWPTPDGKSCAVDFLLKDRSLFDSPDVMRGEQSSIIVRHSLYGAIFAYLNAGNPVGAVRLGRDLEQSAKQMLYEKNVNPYAAAAAGYALLRSTDPRIPTEWVPWLLNLANWFPRLPDGAVLAGWNLLQQPDPNISQATELLLEAVRRGIPMYSEGIRLLIEGLSVLPDQKIDAVRAGLRRARSWGARIDPREAFTVIRGDVSGMPR